MTGLMQYVDVLFTNEEEAETVFGIQARETNVKAGQISTAGYEDVAAALPAAVPMGRRPGIVASACVAYSSSACS